MKEQKVKIDGEAPKKKERPIKFTFLEQREYETIDSVIAEIENKLEQMEIKINKAATDFVLLEELLLDKSKIEEELEQKMNRWIHLNELAEKIENEKKN